MAKSIENRVEEARRYVAEQLLEIQHNLEGEDGVNGDDRTKILFEVAYLQGSVDMAVYLRDGTKSIADLARLITRERLGFSSGQIETGILHVHPVGLDLKQMKIVPE